MVKKRHNMVLEGINQILLKALTCGSEEELGLACLAVVEQITGSQFGFIGEIDADGLLHDIAISDPGWELCKMYDKTGHGRKRDAFRVYGLYIRVLEEGKSLITNRPARHPDSVGTPEGHPSINSFIGVPLRIGEKIFGIIALANREGGYRKSHVEVVESLAPTIVEAFKRKRAERSLQASERRYRQLFQSNLEAVYLTRLDGTFIDFNDATVRMLGYDSRDELFAKKSSDLYADPALRAELIRILKTEGMVASREAVLLRKDGSALYVLGAASILKDEASGELYIQGIAVNITELKKAEREFRESEGRLRSIFRASPAGIGLVSSPGRILLQVNDRLCTMLGYTADELLGRSARVLYANDDDFEYVGRKKYELLREHGIGTVETRWKCKDGRVLDILLSSSPLDKDDISHGVTFTAYDITDRKRAEAALARESELLQSIYDTIPVFLVLWDARLRRFTVNKYFEEVLGWTDEDVNGPDFMSKVYPDSEYREKVSAFMQALLPGWSEWTATAKDGRQVPVDWANIRLTDETMIGIGVDLRQRKQAERELLRLTEELKRSNADLRQFAYIASHDLQTPLKNVEGFANMLSRRYRGKLDSKADEIIGYISTGVKDMQELILDVLEYSKVGSGDRMFSAVSTLSSLEQALHNLRKVVSERKALIRYDEDLPVVSGDGLQLISLFQNLLTNAIKFSDGIPEISISCQKAGDEYEFAVQDKGIGIPSDYAEEIFDVFRRLQGKGKYAGTGIGLAICKKIVERHGGRIWVESEPGKGSTFFFTLPVPAQ
jgi:PAS domain S-box-containing protein